MWDTYIPPCISPCVYLWSVMYIFLHSIFLLFPLWVTEFSACNFHTLCRFSYFFLLINVFLCSLFTCILCFKSLSLQFHLLFISCLDKSSSGSFPQRYIACVWLHVSDAFWLFEPPAPHCFPVTPLSSPPLSTCILTVLLISYLTNVTDNVKKRHSAVHSAEAASQTYLCSFLKIQTSHTSRFQRNWIVQARCGLILAPSVLFHYLLL